MPRFVHHGNKPFPPSKSASHPRLGEEVIFTIEEGQASFPDTTGATAQALNGKPAQRITLSTDKNGLVAIRPLIGNTEGTIRIKAQALKNDATPGALNTGSVNTASDLIGNATFLIQAKAAQDGPASFSGQVFDDKNKALAGVKVSIARTNLSITSDAEGKFQLDNIPAGRIDLFIDGRTTNPSLDPNQPQFPSLHFEAYAVKGRNNQLAHPIYLPKLSTSPESVKTVGGNEDVILKIPGIDGFQMKVKANSVTFPDGSRKGTLIISPVTADRLPMSPPAGGAQFGIPAWTIQPAGTRFDPPIEVTLPNTRAYPAGDNIPIVQWDHDLAQYVPMGRATVSEDGAVLVTDSGSGLTKAGWGGLCVYDPNKCAKEIPECKDCKKLDTSGECPTCAADAAKNDQKCEEDACKRCQGGSCVEKYSKNKPPSQSGFSYRGPTPVGVKTCNGWGCFYGVEGQPGVSKLFELKAYCTAAGDWKFSLTKTDYTTAIWVDSGINGWGVITPSAVNATTRCAELQNIISNATDAASTHIYIKPNPPPTPALYSARAIWNHELVHFKQFKDAFDPAVNELINAASALSLSIDAYSSESAALAAAYASSQWLRALDRVKVIANDAQTFTAPHPDPNRFRDEALTAIQAELNLARTKLAAGSCTL